MKKMFITAVTLGISLLTLAVGNQTKVDASEITEGSVNTEELAPGTIISSVDDSEDQLPSGRTPRASYITKKKTITVYLGKVSYVPSTRYYQEYNSSYGIWQSGTLYLTRTTGTAQSGITATYSGTIGGFKYW